MILLECSHSPGEGGGGCIGRRVAMVQFVLLLFYFNNTCNSNEREGKKKLPGKGGWGWGVPQKEELLWYSLYYC